MSGGNTLNYGRQNSAMAISVSTSHQPLAVAIAATMPASMAMTISAWMAAVIASPRCGMRSLVAVFGLHHGNDAGDERTDQGGLAAGAKGIGHSGGEDGEAGGDGTEAGPGRWLGQTRTEPGQGFLHLDC